MNEDVAQGYQTNFAPPESQAAASDSSFAQQAKPKRKRAPKDENPKDVNMDSQFCEESHESRTKMWEFAVSAFKRFLLFVSFGPGVVGFLCLLGKILKR